MKNKAALNVLILILLGIIWGSSFILIKKAKVVFAPEEIVFLRLTQSAIALLPFWIRGYKQIPKSSYKHVIASGYIGNGIPVYLFVLAVSLADSSIVGTLNSLTPLFSLIIGMLFYQMEFQWSKIFGILLGFAGAMTLVLVKGSSNLSDHYLAGAFAVCGTIFYGWNTQLTKKNLSSFPAPTVSAGAMLSLGIPASIMLFTTDVFHKLQTVPDAWKALGFTTILAVAGTALALVLYNRLIASAGPVFASSVAYLMPAVAFMWGFLDHEVMRFWHIIGLGMILTGIGLLNFKKSKSTA